jgi:hypothetical protein
LFPELEPVKFRILGLRLEIVSQDGLPVVYAFRRENLRVPELICRMSEHFSIQDISVLEPDIEATIRLIYEQNLLGAVYKQGVTRSSSLKDKFNHGALDVSSFQSRIVEDFYALFSGWS